MKKIILLFITIILLVSLCSCEGSAYSETNTELDSYANGYFTIIKQWGGGVNPYYYIMYANDTKVIYFYTNNGSYGRAITPLYNADGTIQVYQGE